MKKALYIIMSVIQKYAMILSCSYRLFNGNCCCSIKLRINLEWIKQKQYIT